MNSRLYSSLIAALLLLVTPALLRAQAVQPQQLAYAMHLSTATPRSPLQNAPFQQTEPQQTNPSQTQTEAESSAACNPEFAADVSKVIEKNYKVGNSDILNIENKFGKVHINTWNKNEIHVKVSIICRASTDQKAQDLLNKIRIVESREGKNIVYRTEFEPMRINNNNQQGFEINYTVSMPDDNALNIKNSFGDVYLADFKGKADLNVRYGALKTGQLQSGGNTLRIAYGSANCGFINQGNIDLAYGSMNIEGSNALQGSSKFSDFKIGRLYTSLDLTMKYGSLKVDNISKNVSKINVDSGFSPIALRFEDNTSFNFNVNVQYGNFNFNKDHVTLTSLEKNHTSAAYKGNFGSASPKSNISIVSKYGDVKFNR